MKVYLNATRIVHVQSFDLHSPHPCCLNLARVNLLLCSPLSETNQPTNQHQHHHETDASTYASIELTS
jgi:hypothetical protein